MRRSHPLPDQLPGEHTGPQASCGADPLFYNHLQCCHSHTHSHMVTIFLDRSMVVGHVPMVHTCSFICNNHIDMIAHTPAFLWVGEHSHCLDFHHASREWLAFFLITETYPKLFLLWDLNPGPFTQQVSALTIKPCHWWHEEVFIEEITWLTYRVLRSQSIPANFWIHHLIMITVIIGF